MINDRDAENKVIAKLGTRYCVIEIETGEIVYEGGLESKCALALVSGTVYGKGMTKQEARQVATEQSAKHCCEVPDNTERVSMSHRIKSLQTELKRQGRIL